MRDDNGNLMVMYHGSQDAGFHVFAASATMTYGGVPEICNIHGYCLITPVERETE